MAGKVPRPKPKFNQSTLIVYGIIAAIVLIICVMLGAAMDLSTSETGKVDMNQLSAGFSYIASHPKIVFELLRKSGSNAIKMLFMGALCIGLFALYKYSEDAKRLHRRGTEHGSAKWGDEKEMRSLAEKEKKPEFKPILTSDGKRVFDEKGNFVGAIIDNNILLTKEVLLSLNAKQHLLNLNVLIIGGSGSGKTRFFAKPNIMQLNTSYVVTDPKGEILADTGRMLEEAGYKVRVFNTIQMEHSNNYNPFEYVYDHNGKLSEDNIKKMVDVLFKSTKGEGEKEDFWSQKGQSLLESLVFLLFEESEYGDDFDPQKPETRDKTHLNFFSVTEKMRRLQYPPHGSKLPDGFFLERNPDESEEAFRNRQQSAFLCPLDKDFLELQRRKPDSLAYRLYKEVRNAPEETGQSFLSSANVKTFFFNMTNLRNLTCCDNIHLETLGDEKTALFIIISATNSTYNFLAAMMYTQLFDTLSNRANFKYGGALPIHVRCIMDEFANIGQIPDFDKVIAFVRSMGMSLNVIIQNLAQLKSRYEKTWEVITGNCDSLLFLGGKEESTLKSISESLGKETIDIRGHNRTKGRQSSTSENNSIMGRELMQQNELQTMPISDCILMIRSHNPFYCTKYPLQDHPNYKLLADGNKSRTFHVESIHAITIDELQAQADNTSVDTNINAPDTATDDDAKARNDIEVAFTSVPTTFEDVLDLFEDADDASVVEIFAAESEPEYGRPSPLDSYDLGSPTEEGKEEFSDVDDIASAVDDSGNPVDTYINPTFTEQQYADSTLDLESFADMTDESVADAVTTFSEHIASTFGNPDDYSIDGFDDLSTF